MALLLCSAAAGADTASRPPEVFLNGSFEWSAPGGAPLAWYVEADPATTVVAVDGARSRSGHSALRVRKRTGDSAYIYTPLPNAGCVRRAAARAAVSARVPAPEVALFFLEPGEAARVGQPAGSDGGRWVAIDAVRDGGAGCLPRGLLLGLLVTGEGEAWIDDVGLSLAPVALRHVGPPRRPTEADLDSLRQRTLPLGPDGALNDDTRNAVRRLFADAKIAGLGENSHGAGALFSLKLALVRTLVEDLDFTLFALEMPATAADTVNAYLQGHGNDEDAVLRALSYPAWQTEEMWSVLEWLRQHNRRASRPLRFFGLDTPAADDAGMAKRAIELLAAADDDARLIVWADNTHVTRAGNAMGAILAEHFGERYVALGLTFGDGYYSAYGAERRYPAHEAYPGTHEHLLAAAGPDAFLVALSDLPEHHPLRAGNRGFRYIGSRPQTFHQFYPHRLPEHFDIVGFVHSTDSTRYLLPHEF